MVSLTKGKLPFPGSIRYSIHLFNKYPVPFMCQLPWQAPELVRKALKIEIDNSGSKTTKTFNVFWANKLSSLPINVFIYKVRIIYLFHRVIVGVK